MKSIVVSAAAALLVAVCLTGCSGSSKPAICGSVDDLTSSVDSLKNIQLNTGALSQVQQDLTQIQQDIAKVKSDAQSQYATQISALRTSYASLTRSVHAAQQTPNVTTVAAVGTAMSAFGTAVQKLVSDVRSTC